MKEINTILFDLDGTLTNSPEVLMGGYVHAMSVHLPDIKLSEDDQSAFLGRTLDNNFAVHTSDEALATKLKQTYRNYTSEKSKEMLKAYPNAKNVVKYLIDNDIKVGIVTSKSYDVVISDLKIAGLDNLFEVIVAYEHTEKHKPNPDSLLKALELLNSTPEQAIYVGDHENDIKAAHNAMMQSVAVTFSYRLDQALRENPTYIVDDLIQVLDIII